MASAEPVTGQLGSTKLGRPLKFQSVADLQKKIDAYFKKCDPHWVTEVYWDYPDLVVDEELEEQGHGGALKRRRNRQLDYDAEPVRKKRKVLTRQIPYTITGLAMALDTTRETLLDYGDGKYDRAEDDDDYDPQGADFSDTIKKAKLRCQNFAELYLYEGKNTAGAIFNLKNNHGWIDKQIEEGTQELIVTTRKHKRHA